MKSRASYILSFCILFAVSCKKKEKAVEETPIPPVVITPVEPDCENLPPTPQIGWTDSLPDKNKSINSFFFDPGNPNRIVYIANGDEFGHNKLFFYDVPTQKARFICNVGDFLPQVNSKGWITFSDVDNNINLIKDDGNTIRKFTTNKHCMNPKWDVTGNYIYYFSEPYSTLNAQMHKIDTTGQLIDILQVESPYFAMFNKKKRILFVDLGNPTSTVKIRYLDTALTDKSLISGPTYSKPGQVNFEHLCIDRSDENFIWSNSNGIFRCNISSLKIDTLAKTCPNRIFRNPVISIKADELTYSMEVIVPLDALRLVHSFKAIEMNLNNRETTEIRIFP